jgi:nucleoside phosphorylase
MANQTRSPTQEVDVLIVTAVKDEQDVVLRLEDDWQDQEDKSGFTYFTRRDEGGLSWALARAADMGPELAANVATRLVSTLKPRCLAMVGVCAGWRAKVQLGDVIIAERLFRYDAGKLRAFREGKEREEEVFHDIRTYNLDPRWSAEDFSHDWINKIRIYARPVGYRGQEQWVLEALSAASTSGTAPQDRAERKTQCPDWTDVISRLEKRNVIQIDGGLCLTDSGHNFLREMHDRYPDGFPPERTFPKSFVAPMATGNRVVEDDELFPAIHQYLRKTLGVDMEGAAVAAVAEIEGLERCLVVKAVQDHADREKDDRYRNYAIEASYRFLADFLRRQMGPPKKGAPFILPQHETTTFTGREDELKALKEALFGEHPDRVCTIAGLSGTGGIGKSALAVHFATINRYQFPGGVIGVRVDGKDNDTIAREFARTPHQLCKPYSGGATPS